MHALSRTGRDHSAETIHGSSDATDRERLRLLTSAVENASEGVTVTTATLDFPGPIIVFVNPAICAMTGYSSEELVGVLRL